MNMGNNMKNWDSNTYDNRGFNALDRSDNKSDFIESMTDDGAKYDPYNPDMMWEALGEIPEKILKAEFNLFLLAHKKGDHHVASRIIFDLVHGYCRSRASDDFENPDY